MHDVKIRDNRAHPLPPLCCCLRANNIVTEPFLQGDTAKTGPPLLGGSLRRSITASVVSEIKLSSTICFVEWTNEQDPLPEYSSELFFQLLSISVQYYFFGEVAPVVQHIVINPMGRSNVINGLLHQRQPFSAASMGLLMRCGRIDTSFAIWIFSAMRNI